MRVLSIMKAALRRSAPDAYAWLHARYAPYPRLARKVARSAGLRVLEGPFRGLEYPDAGAAHRIIPKLIGSYECELAPVWEELLRMPFRHVVNIGCAEGYYAVGLARTLPGVQVTAFELDEGLRVRCRKLAVHNHVADRLEVRGACTPDDFEHLQLDNALVVLDCEGCELDLLSGPQVPRFVTAHLLVETHEWLHPGLSRMLADRFAGTHDVQVILQQARDPSRYSALRGLSSAERAIAVDEERRVNGVAVPQHWLHLRPRSIARNSGETAPRFCETQRSEGI